VSRSEFRRTVAGYIEVAPGVPCPFPIEAGSDLGFGSKGWEKIILCPCVQCIEGNFYLTSGPTIMEYYDGLLHPESGKGIPPESTEVFGKIEFFYRVPRRGLRIEEKEGVQP